VVADACSAGELARLVEEQYSHVWMVRAYLAARCPSCDDDEELSEVILRLSEAVDGLCMPPEEDDPERYLDRVRQQLQRLEESAELYHEIQPELPQDPDFRVANRSLRLAIERIHSLLHSPRPYRCQDA
jgi:hypothetical protein